MPSLGSSVSSFSPSIMRQAVVERDLALRAALACVKGEGEVDTILDKLRAAYLTRLDITQTIIDSYTS